MKASDPIAQLLERTPADLPAFVPDIDAVVAAERRRAKRRHAVAVAISLAVVAGASLSVLGLTGISSRTGRHGVPSSTPAVSVERIPVRGAVDVRSGDGSIWVSGFGVVTRLDPVTGRPVRRIRTPGTEDFSGLAVGAGGVWVSADHGRVYRIDPAVSRVVATIHVPGTAMALATGGGYVWVSRPDPGAVTRIDPRTNRISGRDVPAPGVGELRFAFGKLWMEETSPAGVVTFDPRTNRIQRFPLCCRFARYRGSMWFVSGGALLRADPTTGRILGRLSIPRAADLAFATNRLYVLAAPRSRDPTLFYPIRGTARVWQVDPQHVRITGRTAFDALQPIAITVGGGAVWVADYNGQIVYRFVFRP